MSKDDHSGEMHSALIRLDELMGGTEYTEEDLVHYLAGKVGEMLDSEPDLLFSTLYRLDVSEKKIREALDNGDEAPTLALARLIIDRQKRRMESRKKYKSPPLDEWENTKDD